MSEWTAEKVAQRFEECVYVLDKLPGPVSMGYKNYWPEIILEPREIERQEKFISTLRPTPDQITRMEETLQWFQWINEGERHLAWWRGYRYPWRAIARKTGFPKSSAQRYWQIAMNKIAQLLNEKVTR